MLLEDRRGAPAEPDAMPVRRYRLARLCIETSVPGAEGRFEYLKRIHD